MFVIRWYYFNYYLLKGTFHTCGPGYPPSGHPSGQFTSFCNKVYSCSIPYLSVYVYSVQERVNSNNFMYKKHNIKVVSRN